MSIKDNIPPYLANAAELFFEELESHLAAIESLVESNSGDTLSEAARDEIAKRFHTIRGGAGFLKIGELHGIATAGEKESDVDGIPNARVLELVKQIREILSTDG